ncbi:hypothetical protein V6N13_091031 [Hibiscus sabdariffa]
MPIRIKEERGVTAQQSIGAEKMETVHYSSSTAPVTQHVDPVDEFLEMTPHHSNVVQDAFDWSSPPTKRNFLDVDILEASGTLKRKA